MAGQEAIDLILATTGVSIDLIPTEVVVETPPRPAPKKKREWLKAYQGDLKTLDIPRLFESSGLWVRDKGGDEYEVQCPWSDEHSGEDSAGILAPDPTKFFPTFHCFHAHCEGRTIKDVVEFFGKDLVDQHCEKPFQSSGEESSREVISPTIDHKNLMNTARTYLESRGDGLVHHAGEWKCWDGNKYLPASKDDVRSAIWRWLETTTYLKDGEVVAFRPAHHL